MDYSKNFNPITQYCIGYIELIINSYNRTIFGLIYEELFLCQLIDQKKNYIIVLIIAALIDAGTTYAVVLPSADDDN